VTGFDAETVDLEQIFSAEALRIAARSLVIVGQRAGGSALFDALQGQIASLLLTGDAIAPGVIAHAVYQGHKTARELGVAGAALRVGRDMAFAPRPPP